MSMVKVTPRILALLMDGREHKMDEMIPLCEKVVTPEDCVRAYLRKHHYNEEKTSQTSFEEQVRNGLKIRMVEVFQMLELKGEIIVDCEGKQTFVKMTEKGFSECINNKGRSARVMKQLMKIIKSGNYWVSLERRLDEGA